MKKFKRAIYILSFVLIFMIFSIKIGAEATDEYVISQADDKYLLSYCGAQGVTEVARYEELSDAFVCLSKRTDGGRVVLNGVSTDKPTVISSLGITLSGTLNFTNGATLTQENSNISFISLSVSFSGGGGMRIKSGSLNFTDSQITSDGVAVRLDYASDAKLTLSSGKIESTGASEAVFVKYGSVEIFGGAVECSSGTAIKNHATLTLSGRPTVSGEKYDVITESPISLSGSGVSFSSNLKIKYNETFQLGNIYCVLYDVTSESIGGITLYSENEKVYTPVFFSERTGIDEKNFGAVYLPYTVEYYVNEELFDCENLLNGEYAKRPQAQQKEGYEFLFWSCDGKEFDFGCPIEKNIQLHAKYKLLPPEFRISSLDFVYDGTEHSLKPDELYHPLLEGGTVSYLWYKNGELFSDSHGELRLKNVSDSGKYCCEIRFSYSSDTVTVRTPEVTVNVKRARVTLPLFESTFYSGEIEKPKVYSTALYSVECAGGVLAGVYPVIFRIYDAENYEFFENGESVIEKDFEILKAENFWTDEPHASDIYEGMSPKISAKSRFGNVKFTFSEEIDGVYIDVPPTLPGVYYVKAAVEGCDNYSELVSEPEKFSVIAEKVSGMSLHTPPRVESYTAFDSFVYDGLVLSVSYNSGRRELVDAQKINFSYQSAENFRFGDTGIIATYLDFSIIIPLNIKKADFDLSSIGFSDKTVTYDGSTHTILPMGSMPVGLDGSILEYSIVGEGVNAGEFTVVLSFFTSSKNYNPPNNLYAKLRVLPKETAVVWQDEGYVYTGELYAPSAYYLDIYGRKVLLAVSGGASLAGRYTAVASLSDSNYKLTLDTFEYEIKKADYDMSNVYWTGGDFLYDGEEKRVFLSGLPDGVRVLGYGNASATKAGRYVAAASLSFDERNYNPPPEITYSWEIRKRDYDISAISFSDAEYVYDGAVKHPTLSGDMPTGIDGIRLSCVFDKGAINVSDGKVLVTLSFLSESENYNIPPSISAYVSILPKEIIVFWSSDSFVYNGAAQYPCASAKECDIEVLGGAVDSGEYTAHAVAKDNNYKVSNSEMRFIIQKAENRWIDYLSVSDVFFGRVPMPFARAYSGDVSYKYYSDIACATQIDSPTEVGEYYVVAYCAGDKNHKPIVSNSVSFLIIEIIPVSIEAEMKKDEISAFSKLCQEDFILIAHNNDGTSELIPYDKVDIKYGTDGNFKVGDGKIVFSYAGLSYTTFISVVRADYDMSAVRWSEESPVYNGEKIILELVGLPLGVEVISYTGMGFSEAGKYTVGAVFSYDEDNYNSPILSITEVTVRPATVKLPAVNNLIYNKMPQMPSLEPSELYTVEAVSCADAGRYFVDVSIRDKKNYRFEDGSFDARLEYSILKAPVVIEIFSIDKYLFSRMPSPEYRIVSGIATFDELKISFVYNDDSVSAISENSNYDVTVIPGKIIRHNTLSEDGIFLITLLILIALLIAFSAVLIFIRRKRIVEYFSVVRVRGKALENTDSPAKEIAAEPTDEVETLEESKKQQLDTQSCSADIERTALSINCDHADSLITDSLAKNLLRKDDNTVFTRGKRKEVINVDTLSDNFSAGDRVDVNKLKQMSLVPYDTAYIKVLARGIIDKPLRVYANDFSLAAVKMIALTGGEAIRVTTVKIKDGEKK